MKYLILLTLSLPLFGAAPVNDPRAEINKDVVKKRVEKVTSFEWDGKNFLVHLGSLYTPVKVPGNSKMAPCLENAVKANMEILIEINPNVPTIESCKLYSQGFAIPQTIQTEQ